VGREDWEGGCIGRILSPVMNVLLQLHVDGVSYHSGDCRIERLVHSITVVQIHINIGIYYSVVHHVRILDKILSGTRTQLLSYHLIGMIEFGGSGGRKVYYMVSWLVCSDRVRNS
jgi:hypothetical protein